MTARMRFRCARAASRSSTAGSSRSGVASSSPSFHHVTEAVAAEARPAIPGGGELLRRGELGGEVEDLLEIVGLIRGSLRIDHRSVSPETVRAA